MPHPSKLSREQILEAALLLLEQGGPETLTMRPLAEKLGVRPSSLYRHFPGREALLSGLSDLAAGQLEQQLHAALQREGAREALTQAALAYLAYSRQHPHLYALLLQPTPQLSREELAQTAGKHLWNTLLALVGRLSGNPDDTGWAIAYWTFLHGYAELERSGMFGQSGPSGGFELGLKALLDGMERG